MTEYTTYHLYFTTADIESMYFYGETDQPDEYEPVNFPYGTYRVIAGELFRIVEGTPYIGDSK